MLRARHATHVDMSRWFPTLLLTLACAASPAPATLHAGTGIERCVADDGITVYTDRSCRAMDAKSVPVSAELATRLLQERARERDAIGTLVFAADGTVDAATYVGTSAALADAADTRAAPAPPGRRSVAAGCARSPTQLQMDLRGAFALGDVNRIAESYHWVGVSPRGAARTMDRLASLARRQVEDTPYFDAQIGDAGMMFADAGSALGGASIGGSGGVMQVVFTGDGGASVVDFDVERYKGCWFVRF